MLKKITLIATLFIGTCSWGQWSSQTSGTTNDLRAITFPSATVGYAAGFGGTILKTTNGGSTWTSLSSGIAQDLYSVLFISETTGFVFGDGGKILKTVDGGLNWVAKVSGTTNSLLTSYLFSNNTTIYAAGASGTIKKSTDAGETWTSVTSGTTEDINSISFDASTNMTGYFVGNNAVVSYIYKSTDGGANWVSQALPPNNVNSFFSISTIDANNVFFCGGVSKILKTTDGGSNWSNVNNSTATFYRSCLFNTASEGYVVGGNGKIIHTTNAGSSYSPETTGVTAILNSICKTSCGTYFVAGNGGVILKKGASVSGVADNYPTNQAAPLVVPASSGVLANDGQTGVTVAIGTNATNGNVILNSDGAFVYTPNSGYTGNDSFTYIITDGCGNSSNPVIVTIASTAALDEISEKAPKIYPTVVSDQLHLNFGSELLNVEIFNALGSVVFESDKIALSQVSVAKWNNGVYLVKVQDSQGKMHSQRIIVNK